jgi:hypothetical protein
MPHHSINSSSCFRALMMRSVGLVVVLPRLIVTLTRLVNEAMTPTRKAILSRGALGSEAARASFTRHDLFFTLEQHHSSSSQEKISIERQLSPDTALSFGSALCMVRDVGFVVKQTSEKAIAPHARQPNRARTFWQSIAPKPDAKFSFFL